jgi:hypothetical protein
MENDLDDKETENGKLQTSKNKLTNSLWEYRGFFIEKKDKEWKIKIPDGKKIRNQETVLGYSNKLIKQCCLQIDNLLGIIPLDLKKKNEEKYPAELLPKKGYGKYNLDCNDAKIKAYEFRNDKELGLGVPNKTKELGLIGFSLIWNKIDPNSIRIVEKYNCKYLGKFSFCIIEKENNTSLEVNVII